MKHINLIKEIREVYGATQNDIGAVTGVSRSTVSQWETGVTKAPNSKLEKLAEFYGIDIKYFYEIEKLDDVTRNIIISSAKEKRIVKKEIDTKSENKLENNRNKPEELATILDDMTFEDISSRYIFSMKMMLALSDYAGLDELKKAYEINQKMGVRLKAMIKIREEEERLKEDGSSTTLFDLLNEQ